jgi:hypothetical protein
VSSKVWNILIFIVSYCISCYNWILLLLFVIMLLFAIVI